MKKMLVPILAMMLMTACTQPNSQVEVPRIDQSAIQVKNLLWNLDSLQEVPTYTYIDSTSHVHEILFKGPDYQGKPTEVFAYYSNPDILRTGKSQGNKFPGVVLISGGSQPAIKEWVERWAQEGYAAITCDYGNMQYVEGRGPITKGLEQIWDYIYDRIDQGPKAVREHRTASIAIQAHSLLLSLPEVIKDKTAVTGISWGGVQTCIVSGLDNRFKAAVPVYGCGFHDEIMLDKKHYDGLTAAQRKSWMEHIDPKNYVKFSQCPTLFITGDNDGCFDIGAFDKTTKLIPEKNRYYRITPNMGHDMPIGWRPQEIAAFFNAVLMDKVPLARITNIAQKDSLIEFGYDSPLTIKNAKFYYTNDTVHINAERIWKHLPAKIEKEKIVATIPEEGFIYGYLYVTDTKDLTVSSRLLRNDGKK